MKSQTFVRSADAELVLEHRPYCGCRKGQGLVELGCVRGYLVPATLTGVLAGPAAGDFLGEHAYGPDCPLGPR